MSDVTTATDPTQSVLSESALSKKSLCDYVINVATGCRHGCRFCYVPSTPQVRTRPDMLTDHADVEDPQREWGSYVLYRDDLPERLDGILKRKRTWNTTPKGRGVVGISFATDCYMDGRAGRITRDVVAILAAHDLDARVLTRNPILALQNLPTFRNPGERVTIGSLIPALDAEQVGAIEPHAPAPGNRLRGLREFADAGVLSNAGPRGPPGATRSHRRRRTGSRLSRTDQSPRRELRNDRRGGARRERGRPRGRPRRASGP
jgi:DNA repair photolyase